MSVCLRQVSADQKSNEVTAIHMRLDLLATQGNVVPLDVMNCQRETVAKIRDKKADYLITIKANLGALRKEIAEQMVA